MTAAAREGITPARLRAALAAMLLAALMPGCAEHLKNPLPPTVRDGLVLSSIRVEMHTSGGPLRGIDIEDPSSLAAKIEASVEQQFQDRLDRAAADGAAMRIVVTSYGIAHGAVSAVGGQVAHHIDGRAEIVQGGRLVATYSVHAYRETGNLGVLIGAARGSDPGWALAEAFARQLHRRFNAG